MTRTFTAKLRVSASAAAAALVVSLVLGIPALAAVGAALAAVVAVAFAVARTPELTVRFELATDLAVEGQELAAALTVIGATPCDVEVALAIPDGLRLVDGGARQLVHVPGVDPVRRDFTFSADRWGAYTLGELAIRAGDPFGMVGFSARSPAAAALRVYPRVERLRTLVDPAETQPTSGSRVAPVKGDGIEFADVRPFVTGDRVRRINWRETSRRQQLYVNDAHPERNSDVVLFLDTFAHAGGRNSGTLDAAIRLTASFARAYLEQRDRVGVVGFGAVVRWLTPGLGTRQLYRIVDALLSSEVSLSYAWKGLEVLPPRSLPPKALVLALTPLLDDRAIGALTDLRARRFDLAIVDVSPLSFVQPGSDVDPLAPRLWALWREALRYRYERLGVPVVEWRPDRSAHEVLGEVVAFRRSQRRVSA